VGSPGCAFPHQFWSCKKVAGTMWKKKNNNKQDHKMQPWIQVPKTLKKLKRNLEALGRNFLCNKPKKRLSPFCWSTWGKGKTFLGFSCIWERERENVGVDV
jgi:hypothetical protein